ncbi:kinase-like protein [Aspergillus sclerotiicarbonarius CBS 121057]|uniref:Kinase-like protein n=1 Tax=Aspergillus sclerotiicarbonarius (strain CBS 121057 / IBT 28362) TaxID=1448318 RepID=A0A319FB28_ASPSB|nr:kinase-like protein [Aspergillus sclerotiicarbonarius CBS 121057]
MAGIGPLPDVAADFGDYVRDQDEEDDLDMVVESCYKYDPEETPDTFYPICLGEVLNERYLIEHKAGHGGGSTVWMAHDLQAQKDVALKVMALGEWGGNDIRIQDEIIQTVPDTSHLVIYRESFFIPGDHGHHRVLVFPLMGPCIDRFILHRMPVATRMSAARQLLEALENLHQAGIVHRDLNEANCMWGMVPLHNLSRSAKYETLGRPVKQIIPEVKLWKQGERVQSMEVPEDLRTDDFYLGDFGLAKKLHDPVTQRGYPPMRSCSPERLHGKDPSFACDMWSYMVLFSKLYLRFEPFLDCYYGGVIHVITRCLGPLPEQWKGLYIYSNGRDSWYDQSQKPIQDESLALLIARRRPDADPIERQHMLSVMSKVFTYYPEKRPTATQLLHDPSFRAIMDNYGC